MPVYKIESEMPHKEFSNWMRFLNNRPVGWREDQRTFLLLKANGFKGKPTDLFPALKPIYDQRTAAEGVNAPMPSGKFLSMLQNSVSGDVEAKQLFNI
jgi:hypothetical protein